MVDEILTDDLRRRSKIGLVGFARSGPNANRYLCLVLSDDDPVTLWEIYLSSVDAGSWEYWSRSDRGWEEVAADMATWDIAWAPEELNDRVLFRAFAFPETGLDSEWRDRKRRVRAQLDGLTPIVPGSNSVRVPMTVEYLQSMIVELLTQERPEAPHTDLNPLSERQLRKLRTITLRPLAEVFNALWDKGHALTIVPLGRSVTVGPLADPWLPFRGSDNA